MLHLRCRGESLQIRTLWPLQKSKSYFLAKVCPSLSKAQTRSICSIKALSTRNMLLFIIVTLLSVPATLTQIVAIDELYIQPTPSLHVVKEVTAENCYRRQGSVINSSTQRQRRQHFDSTKNSTTDSNFNSMNKVANYAPEFNDDTANIMKLEKYGVIDEFLDEGRYNLATRVMSNGVELIIANDKSKLPAAAGNVVTEMLIKGSLHQKQKQQVSLELKSVPSHTPFRPMTLAPSTLKDKMIFVMPTQSANQTPTLATGIFPTTYSYYNTILDDDHPVVQLSKYTIVNTVKGPDGYINFLQPSEEATPIYETNTYYSKLTFTNVLQTTEAGKLFVTTDILTQVIVTESLSPRSSLLLKNIEASSAQINNESDEILPYKKSEPIQHPKRVLFETESEYNMHIYTTKTFVTTLNYLKTTLASASDDENFSTTHRTVPSKKLKTSITVEQIQSSQNVYNSIINYRTRIFENVITETIPSSLFKSELVSKFCEVLKTAKPEHFFITSASLLNGQMSKITAMRVFKPSLVTAKEEVKNTIVRKQTTAIMSANVPLQMIHTFSDILSKRTKANATYKITTTAAKMQNSSTALVNALHTILDEDMLSADTEYNAIYSKSPQFLKQSKPQKHQIKQHLVDNIIIATTTNNKNRLPVTVSEIIDSLSLQRLNALQSVINAMADLLQGSFITAQNQQQLQLLGSSSVPFPLSTGAAIESIVSSTQMNSTNHYNYQEISGSVIMKQEKPIYIPVTDYEIDSHRAQSSNIAAVSAAGDPLGANVAQSLDLQPPLAVASIIADADNWLLHRPANNKYLQQHDKLQTLSHQKQQINSLKNLQNLEMLTENNNFDILLINGGIPIRPGEVITANSDVIIGKPNGIRHPQIPLTSNYENLEEQGQKYSTKNYHIMYKQHYITIGNEKKQMQANGGKTAPFIGSHISTIPLRQELQIQNQNSQRKPILQHMNNLPPKLPLQQTFHSYYIHSNVLPTENYDNLLKPPPPALQTVLSNTEELELMPSLRITNFKILKSLLPTTVETPVRDLHKSKKGYYVVNYNNASTHTDTQIFENKLTSNNSNKLTKIHDLMLNTSKKYVNYYGKVSQIHQLPEASTFEQQAQQMENSQNEKSLWEYSPYSYSSLNGTYDNVELRRETKTPAVHIGTQAVHQNINLHTHVFSHNVNMHAPPLTFKKETDYPKYAKAVHGTIPKQVEGTVRHIMPLIKIPHNEKQVQINLTPQNVVEQIGNHGVIAHSKDATNTKIIYVENTADSSVVGSFSLYNSFPSELTNKQQPKSEAQNPLQTQFNHNYAHLYIIANNNNITDTHNQSSDNREDLINEYQRIFIPAAAGVTTSDTFTQHLQPQYAGYDVNIYNTNANANMKLTGVIKNVTSVYPAIAGSLNIASLYFKPDKIIGEMNYLKSLNKYDTAVNTIADNNSNLGAHNNVDDSKSKLKHSHYVIVDDGNSELNVDQYTASATNNLYEKIRTEQQKVLKQFFSPIAALEVNNMHTTTLEQLNCDITKNSVRNSTIPSSRKNIRPITYYISRVTQKHTIIPTKWPVTFRVRLNEKNYTQNTQLLLRGAPFETERSQKLENDAQQQQKKPVYFAKGDGFKNNHGTFAISVHTDNLPSIESKSKQEYRQTSKTGERNTNNKLAVKERISYAATTMHWPNTNKITAPQSAINNKQPTNNDTRVDNQSQHNISNLPLRLKTSSGLSQKQQQSQSLLLSTVKPQTSVVHTSNTQAYKTIDLKTINHSLTLTTDAEYTTALYVNEKKKSTPVQQSIEYETQSNTDELFTIKTFVESSEAATISPSGGGMITDTFAQITALPNEFVDAIVKKLNLKLKDKIKSQWHLKYNSTTNSSSDAMFYKNIKLLPTEYITRTQLITVSSSHNTILTTTANAQLQNTTFFENSPQMTTTGNIIIQSEWTTETATATESEIETLSEKANASAAKILRKTYINIVAGPTMGSAGSALAITEMIVSGTEGKTPENSLNDANDNATMLTIEVLRNDNTNKLYTQSEHVHFTQYNQSQNGFVVYENAFDLNKINIFVKNRRPILDISNVTTGSDNVEPKNSIFIMMTNSQSNVKTKQQYELSNVIKLGSAGTSSSATGAASDIDNIDTNARTIQLDYDDSVSVFNLPTRDEDSIAAPHDSHTMINQVLPSGVLIATPPKLNNYTSITPIAENSTCLPQCKTARNEVCTLTELRWRCVCRPGFARMFPDRPCKPTYTYELSIPIDHYGDFKLFYDHSLADNSTDEYKHLATVTKEAINRMVMQSDLRDIYHGIQLSTYNPIYEENMGTGKSANREPSDITANLLLQLSENSDGERLMAVFKKYLRLSNYSIGGTKLFTDHNGVESLAVTDFNECAYGNFHDCSSNALCFNLQGTYTCSCKEGFADLSGSTIYPGRVCSAELVGCDRCHYHGKCAAKKSGRPYASEHVVCECFAWYTGSTCKLNLKIFLIILIAVGTLLFTLLLFCILLMYAKQHTLRKKYPPSSQSGTGLVHRITTSKNSRLRGIGLLRSNSTHGIRACRSKRIHLDNRAIIKDTSSESSQKTLLYVMKQQQKKQSSKNLNIRGPKHVEVTTVRNITIDDCELANMHLHQLGALVSAGFEVSTSVGDNILITSSNAKNEHITLAIDPSSKISDELYLQTHRYNNDGARKDDSRESNIDNNKRIISLNQTTLSLSEQQKQQQQHQKMDQVKLVKECSCRSSGENRSSGQDVNNLLDSMDVWFEHCRRNELSTEAHFPNESAVRTAVKPLHICFDALTSNANDDASTMAERDVGSTFLLPHTHLYKPDKDALSTSFGRKTKSCF